MYHPEQAPETSSGEWHLIQLEPIIHPMLIPFQAVESFILFHFRVKNLPKFCESH